MLVSHVFLRSTSSGASTPQHAVVSCCYMLRASVVAYYLVPGTFGHRATIHSRTLIQFDWLSVICRTKC